MQPVLKELMSVKGLILLIALVALGLSITSVVGGGCGSSFGDLCEGAGCPKSDIGCERPKPGEKDSCNKYAEFGRECNCTFPSVGDSPKVQPGGICKTPEDCLAGANCVDDPHFSGQKTCRCGNKGVGKSCGGSNECISCNCLHGITCEPYRGGNNNSPPSPPSHPSGFNPGSQPSPQASPPSPSKKGGGMLGGGGSILGGSTIGGKGGKKSPDIPIKCGKTNTLCSGEEDCCDDYKCKRLLGGSTCQRKSPSPSPPSCAEAGDPCGPMSGAKCCSDLNCKIKEGDNSGIGQCVHSGGFNPSPPSPTDGLPEWAVYSLWSAGGVTLIAIVIYLIMQMQSGKVN